MANFLDTSASLRVGYESDQSPAPSNDETRLGRSVDVENSPPPKGAMGFGVVSETVGAVPQPASGSKRRGEEVEILVKKAG